MDSHRLAELRLQTGYIFENGSPFYEKLGEERAAALLRALRAEGYRIVPERDLSTRSDQQVNAGPNRGRPSAAQRMRRSS